MNHKLSSSGLRTTADPMSPPCAGTIVTINAERAQQPPSKGCVYRGRFGSIYRKCPRCRSFGDNMQNVLRFGQLTDIPPGCDRRFCQRFGNFHHVDRMTSIRTNRPPSGSGFVRSNRSILSFTKKLLKGVASLRVLITTLRFGIAVGHFAKVSRQFVLVMSILSGSLLVEG